MIIKGRSIVSENCPALGGVGVDLTTAEFELNVLDPVVDYLPEANGDLGDLNVWGTFYAPGAGEEERRNYMETLTRKLWRKSK